MEDYNSNLLNDSKNEWSIRLMNILSGHIIDGFRSIFNEAIDLCEKNDEPEKYLMTFQNFLSRIPKWNQNMIETEHSRIKESSKCEYLDDLVTCVHVIQLKILSCVRTSNQNKKIDINIPDFTTFFHNVYINIARKLYSNIYLFQVDITPLEQQKNNREFEVIVQSCIMNTIRDNIPVDDLLKQYIDETQEIDIIKKEKVIKHEVVEEPVEEEKSQPETPSLNVDAPLPPAPAIMKETEKPNNISFGETVEKYDPVNDEKTSIPISFEPKEDPHSMNNEDDEKLVIGDEIKLNLDDSSDLLGGNNSLKPETINIESEKNSIIDLGIEEISL